MRANCFIFLVMNLLFVSAVASESVCFGTTDNGRLIGGVQLPSSGPNFESYGSIPSLIGRTYVHSKVRDIVVEAYRALQKDVPNKSFKYAETGFKEGGKYSPHKTHQNGLSIDFMVPVIDKKGSSVHLPTHALNRYGYDIEFDSVGRYKEYTIDFEAMGAHIVALYESAKKGNIGIWRVLFDPQLQSHLYRTQHGDFIRNNITIPTKKSWVRHDEHYHVDFVVPCKGM